MTGWLKNTVQTLIAHIEPRAILENTSHVLHRNRVTCERVFSEVGQNIYRENLSRKPRKKAAHLKPIEVKLIKYT